jgi:hypothetical protein
MKSRGMKSNRVLYDVTKLIIIALLASPSLLVAQAQRAIILGRALDPNGGAIPGVEVKVIQKSTNVARTTLTNERGNYEVPGLFPGTYRIEAVRQGFKTSITDDVPVESAQRVEVNISLQLGTMAQSIEVKSEQQILNVANADTNTVFNQKKIADLPIGAGNTTFLFQLSPGADDASGSERGGLGMDIQPMQRAGTSLSRMNGSPTGTNEYTIDGSPNMQRGNSRPGGSVAFNLSPEVVEEVRVQTNTFDASVGHSGGATVDLTMKSGTNDYHGSAYGFLRLPSWCANSWDANLVGQPRPDFTFRRWGFSGGGPVWFGPLYKGKNKTFFYYGFEKWSQLSPNPPTDATVPTPKELTGDFSDLLKLGPQYQLYDPDTAKLAPDGRITRLPFPNNIIPTDRIDPTALALAGLWPTPNQPGTADGLRNFSYLVSALPRTTWASTVRIDHNLSNSHKLFGRLLLGVTGIPSSSLFGNPATPYNSIEGRNVDVAVGDVWTISPTFVGEFRVSEMRFQWNSVPLGAGIPYEKLGLGSVVKLFNTSIAGIPSVSISGYPRDASDPSVTGFSNGAGSRQVSEIRSGMANFTKVHGNHSIKFGGDIRYYIDNRGSSDQLSTSFTGEFSSGPFDNSPAPPIGAGLADFLLGKYSQATIFQPSKGSSLSTYQGIYINDDWKVTRRLTVNLGLRYERQGPSTERFNRTLSGFALNVDNPIAAAAKLAYAQNPIPEIPPDQFQVKGGLLFAGVNGNPRTNYNADNKNFAPRIGLAYKLNNHLVVRAGYGMFYLPYGQRFISKDGVVPGFDTSTFSFSSLDNGLTFTNTLRDMFSSGLTNPIGPSQGLNTYLGQKLTVPGAFRNLQTAYNQRWQGGIEMVFAKNYKLEVRYVGNRTVKMPISSNLNALPNRYLSTSPERDQPTIDNLTALVPNPFLGIPGVGGSLGTSKFVQKAALLVPYPEFGSITVQKNQGWSTYNGLQIEFERRFAQGLTLQTSYTHASTTDGLAYLNPGDAVPSEETSAVDRPHVWRLLGVWELPFGKGQRFGGNAGGVTTHIISGWQIQGSTFGQSGNPIPQTEIVWPDVLYRGNFKDIATTNQTAEHMFNVAGFETDPAKQLQFNVRTFPFLLGNVRLPAQFGTDFSLIKNTNIGERFKIQFRAEGYNAFNGHFYPGYTLVVDPTSSAFGSTTDSSASRKVQLGLRFIF